MIIYTNRDIFDCPVQTLVNPINTVGVMGKGLALQFKLRYPQMFIEYKNLCKSGKLKIGNLWLYKTNEKWILNFPTKEDFLFPSRLEYVESGLRTFVKTYQEMNIFSIAFPKLGCGSGQLDFETQVRPMMELYLNELPIKILVSLKEFSKKLS